MTYLQGGINVSPGIGPIGPSGPAGPGFITFGANAISNTTTQRFLYPWYEDNLAPLIVIPYYVPLACTIDRMYVIQNIPGGNGLSSVYTLMKNGIATLLSVSIASTALTASNLINSVVFAQGDLIALTVTKAASIGATPNDIVVSLRISP